MTATLEIKDLHVSVEGKEILKGLNLIIREGETHAIMGPNGSGKSTLAYTIMGHPRYKIEKGQILFNGNDITKLTPDKRAKLGLFLGFQYPMEVTGVTLFNFLKTAYNSMKSNGKDGETVSALEFKKMLEEKMGKLKMDQEFMKRYLNEGFSGGEKKRCEVLQLAVLEPKIAVLDETDSGLDIDALRIVAEGIKTLSDTTGFGTLLITHYQRILQYIKPQFVHVMFNGRIIKSGDEKLAEQLEREGYESVTKGFENA